MKFENTSVSGFENAILGLRLPMSKDLEDAKNKSDSVFSLGAISTMKIGENDLRVIKNLLAADSCDKAGEPNSKFMRMIHVQVCITAPLFLWKELDTYKIGTTANSTSTMHTISKYPITKDCFEEPDLIYEDLITKLEIDRKAYLETKDKSYWISLINNLPESWLQTRMFDCNYATLRNIYNWRKNHKLYQWHQFCGWIESLPYSVLITGEDK